MIQLNTPMRVTTKTIVPIAAIIGWLVLHGSASAASFDCAQAGSPQEHMICDDPHLSQLDGQLGKLYQARKALLSLQGAAQLQKSERSWLKFAATVCPYKPPPYAHPSEAPQACLQARYKERLDELQQVGQKAGPYTFNRIDLFAAEPAQDRYGEAPGFYVTQVAFPQIDKPASQQENDWNKAVAQKIEGGSACDAGFGDHTVDYSVGYATSKLISLQFEYNDYCHGTPHGFGGTRTQNMILQPPLKPAEARDIFKVQPDWAGSLKDLFWAALLHDKDWAVDDQVKAQAKDLLEQDIINPKRWFFTSEGLQVSFNSYEGGCYACNPGPVTVPWTQLTQLMADDSVLRN